jgi:DNA-binding MarR family transcriptional regulator
MNELKSSTRMIDAIATAIMQWQDSTQACDDAIGSVLELNIAERRCLAFLLRGPEPAGAVATATRLTPAAVTALIDRLEKRGLVERRRDASDRRKVIVAMTPKAGQIVEKYYGRIAEEGAQFLSGFTAPELVTILRFVGGAAQLQADQLQTFTRAFQVSLET